MKKYLSILFVSLALLLVSPYYVFAEENNQEQQQIVLAAPTIESGMGDQDTAYLTIILEGAYASGTESIDGYELYKKTSKGNELIGSNETFEHIGVSLRTGKKDTYVARVYVYDSNNNKVYSDYSADFVLDNTLKAPTLDTGMGDQNTVYLTIILEGAYASSTESIDGYELYKKTSKGYTLVASNETFEHIGVPNKIGVKDTYVARVYLYDSNNKKVYSAYSESFVIDNTITMPAFKITNSSYTSLKLSWTHTNANITGYKIYRATSKNGKYSYVATVTPKTDVLEQTLTYNDTKKTFNKTYYYKIRPYHKNENGTTYYGSYSAVKSKKVVTQSPTVVGTTSGFLKNKLTWKKVSGASGYAIYKLVDGKYVYQKSTTSLSYTDTLKNNNKDLEFVNSYKVRAYRTVSGKKIYGAYSEVITITSKLSTPKLTYTGIDHTSYKVKASSISGATTLELYSCVDEICSEDGRTLINSKASIDETINVNSLADKQYYIIRAVRTINGESIYSDFSEVYTYNSKPAKVDIKDDEKYISLVDSKTSIMFGIYNTLENQSFEIYRSTSKNGTYELTDSISCSSIIDLWIKTAEELGNSLTEEELEALRNELGEEQYINYCYDSSVKVGKTYYYKVRAKMVEEDVIYYGNFSDIDIVKVKPEKVDYIVVEPNKYNSTTVEWSRVDGADGYEVYRATSKNGKYTKVKTTTGTTYTHSGTLNQKYYYKVRAYFLDEKGNKVYGSYSSIKSRAIGLTALDSYPIALSNDNATSSIKSVTITQKTTISNQVVLKFKVNYSKTYAVKKQKVYYTVNFYDKNYNFLTSRELYTTLSKGTKRNYSTTFEVKVPKEAVYYEFE